MDRRHFLLRGLVPLEGLEPTTPSLRKQETGREKAIETCRFQAGGRAHFPHPQTLPKLGGDCRFGVSQRKDFGRKARAESTSRGPTLTNCAIGLLMSERGGRRTLGPICLAKPNKVVLKSLVMATGDPGR